MKNKAIMTGIFGFMLAVGLILASCDNNTTSNVSTLDGTWEKGEVELRLNGTGWESYVSGNKLANGTFTHTDTQVTISNSSWPTTPLIADYTLEGSKLTISNASGGNPDGTTISSLQGEWTKK
jgi:hypothetical protein